MASCLFRGDENDGLKLSLSNRVFLKWIHFSHYWPKYSLQNAVLKAWERQQKKSARRKIFANVNAMQMILMPGRYQYSCYFYYRLSVRLGTRNRSDLCSPKIRTHAHAAPKVSEATSGVRMYGYEIIGGNYIKPSCCGGCHGREESFC